MNRWKQCFQDLLVGSEIEVSCMRKETEQETLTENESQTTEDIKYVVEKLKNIYSLSGPDNIIADSF
jgi:hypothetical protein